MLFSALLQLLILSIVVFVFFHYSYDVAKNKTLIKMYTATDNALLVDAISSSPHDLVTIYSEPNQFFVGSTDETPYITSYAIPDEKFLGFYPYSKVDSYIYRLGESHATSVFYSKQGDTITSTELDAANVFTLFGQFNTPAKKVCEDVQTFMPNGLKTKPILFDVYLADESSHLHAQQLFLSLDSQMRMNKNTDNVYYSIPFAGITELDIPNFQSMSPSAKAITLKESRFKQGIIVSFVFTDGQGDAMVYANTPKARKLGCFILNEFSNSQKIAFNIGSPSSQQDAYLILDASEESVVIEIPKYAKDSTLIDESALAKAVYTALSAYTGDATNVGIAKVEITGPKSGSVVSTRYKLTPTFELKDKDGNIIPSASLTPTWSIVKMNPDGTTAKADPTALVTGEYELSLAVKDKAGKEHKAEPVHFTMSDTYSILYVPLGYATKEEAIPFIDAQSSYLSKQVDPKCLAPPVIEASCTAPVDCTDAGIEKLASSCIKGNALGYDLILFIDKESNCKSLVQKGNMFIITTSEDAAARAASQMYKTSVPKLKDIADFKCVSSAAPTSPPAAPQPASGASP